MIPPRIKISEAATTRLRYIKSKTGITPNITCRIALALSVREMRKVYRQNGDSSGQEFNAPTLFGDHQRAYELVLEKYIAETRDDREISEIICSHIDNGLHKMGHVKSLTDLASVG